MGPSLNSAVNHVVSFYCLDFQSTTPVKMKWSPDVSWLVSCWRTVSKVLLQPAGTSLSHLCSLSVPIMGCAVGGGDSVGIRNSSPWWCELLRNKWSGSSDHVSLLNPSAHNLFNSGGCSRSGVCACLWDSVSVGTEVGHTSPWGCWLPLDERCWSVNSRFSHTHWRIASCSVADACVAEYGSVSVLKLQTLLHRCYLNWRWFSNGPPSISTCHENLIPNDRRSPYMRLWVEEWGWYHWRFRVKVHTVQLLVMVPQHHSAGVHRLCGFLAPIAMAGLSSLLSKISFTADHCGGTTALDWGFLCVSHHHPCMHSITHPLLIDSPDIILYVDLHCWPPADLLWNHFKYIPMLTHALPRVLSWSSPKLLTVLVRNVSWQCILQ